ncbi:hypothetical protein BH10PLA2_BH10PLA2_02280 [soil metagenome]
MRNVVLALLILPLVIPAALAQENGQWAEKLVVGNTVKGPSLLVMDFGIVAKGSQNPGAFKLTNPYAVPMEINTKVECNCVTVSPRSLVLQPKESADLNITMDTTRFTGNKNVHIEMTTGPQFVSRATLLVSAQIRGDLVLNPGRINVGSVKAGQTLQAQSLDVEYAGATDFRITEVVENNSPIKLTVKELYRGPGVGGFRVGYRVSADVKENAAPGVFRQEVFRRTNDPAGPLLPVPVEGSVVASLSAVPSTLELGNMKLGQEKLQKVMVRGGKPCRIIGIEGAGDGITYDLPAAPSMIQTVVFHFQPGKVGEVSRKLEIKTDLVPDNAVSIKVEGAVGP